MESIAVTKPNMGVLSQERLALSPFGVLAQSFAEELMARAGQEEGHWSYVPLELLQEEEAPVAPALPAQAVVQVDLKLVLDALRKDRSKTEHLRATERIVERILQRREIQREKAQPIPAAVSPVAPTAAAQTALRLQQNITQILQQSFLVQHPTEGRTGDGLRQQPGAITVEIGRPGQLGQQTKVFTQSLRTLREEGKPFPISQAEDEQPVTPVQKPGYFSADYQTAPTLTHLEEGEPVAETARQGSLQAIERLAQTAEQLERKLQQRGAVSTRAQTTQQMPVSQDVGFNHGHDLPAASARQTGRPFGSLHKLGTHLLAEKDGTPHVAEYSLTRQLEAQKQDFTPVSEKQLRKKGRAVVAGNAQTVIPGSAEHGTRPDQRQAEILPDVELSHRIEESDGKTAQPSAAIQPREKGQTVTAQDIRTVADTAAEQRAQSNPHKEGALPSVELSHRIEEPDGKTIQPPAAIQPREKGQMVTAQDIRTVTDTAAEQRAQSNPHKEGALPSVELSHRIEEADGKTAQPSASIQPREKEQTVTAQDIRTVAGAATEQRAQSNPHKEGALPSVELSHRIEESDGKTAQPSAAIQPREKEQTVTAQDIRTVVGAATEQRTQSNPHKEGALPSVELSHRIEEPDGKTIQPPASIQPREKGQMVTAQDIRTVAGAATEQRTQSNPHKEGALPSVELFHRIEEPESKTIQPPASIQPREKGQMVTAQDIRTVAGAATEQRAQSNPHKEGALPSVELSHRIEEPDSKTVQPPATIQPREKGQMVTAQDIRTVASAPAAQNVQADRGKGDLLPTMELTHRTEEPGGETTQPSTVAQVQEKGQTVTAKNIRTMVSEPAAQNVQADWGKGDLLPGMELTHRTAEPGGEMVQPSTAVQAQGKGKTVTAKDIRTAASTPVAQNVQADRGKGAPLPTVEMAHRTEEQSGEKVQTPGAVRSAERGQTVTARDIEMVRNKDSKRIAQPNWRKGQILSSMELIRRAAGQSNGTTQSAVMAGIQRDPLPGVELTYRTEERFAEHPPKSGVEQSMGGEKASVELQSMARVNGDIRVGRNLLGKQNAFVSPSGASGIAAVPLSDAKLNYGGTPRSTQEERSAVLLQTGGKRQDESGPVELTYGPGQQAANQVSPPAQEKTAPSQGESDYVHSLPDWARQFLRDSWSSPTGTQEIGVARQIATLPEQRGAETVEWSAPNYRPNVPLEHREKQKEKSPQKPQQIHLSEAEIQRAADRVYRILEDRIREERIRLGF